MRPPPPLPPTWGWTAQVRRFLAIAVILLALQLLVLGWHAGQPGPPVPDLKVDPNTAPPEVLEALPGIGPKRAEAIVAARRRGPFRTADDLDRRVRGIGPAITAAMRPYLQFPDGLDPDPSPSAP